MKNIHLLPTDKPSRLYLTKEGFYFLLPNIKGNAVKFQHIYITSDEEIKEGDWFYNIISLKPEPFKACENGNGYVNCSKYSHNRIDCKKIILTTDQELIKEGVQAIDEDFLEWFVKNPSCEKIEVNKSYSGIYYIKYPYKIIIPQEEPKQDEIDFMANELVIEKEKFESKETLEQETCNFCGKTLREQMKGCGEITCYRQFLPKQETLEDFCTRELSNFNDNVRNTQFDLGFRTGAIIGLRFPKERSYNE
jgi:hypothetical protein